MDRPRSAHRSRIWPADQDEAMKSGSKISTPSKPAAAAADNLSSSVPDRHTVATVARRPDVPPQLGRRGTAVSAVMMVPFLHQQRIPRWQHGVYSFPASERRLPLLRRRAEPL